MVKTHGGGILDTTSSGHTSIIKTYSSCLEIFSFQTDRLVKVFNIRRPSTSLRVVLRYTFLESFSSIDIPYSLTSLDSLKNLDLLQVEGGGSGL